MLFVQLFINGIQTGALYALIAAGFSLIFGTTRVFHVAHGAAFTLAGFVFYELYTALGWAWPLAALGAAAAAALFGVLVDRYVYAAIQRHEGAFFTVFVASFGLAIVVQNLITIGFGRGLVTVPTPLSKSVELLPGLYVAPMAAVAVLCALLAFGALQWLLTRTNLGLALRALGENPELVRVYGLTPRRLSQYVFLIGSLLAVPAAILTAATSGLNPAMGHHVMLISIAATIVGGVGSLRGAAVAGLLLGMAENLSLAWIDPQWSEAVTFVVLFLFILFRPGGVFGRAVAS
ncbi:MULTISPECIES: branched-chain amino acid ABC transporter permease [Bordetella]|uniref:Branched-chain amino acid ABC transporter permease n=2 Tax=Bordetella TaxID=517 RepID=A0A261VYC3_9BORD|nr:MULTISPECIES: branched-chain amino acid ABC transporter permease [Bordetella]MDM9560012.1 branched-chain amino acid ABC transporter permease [Bordetella petrii]OZI79116.1 branched-chain amino acid ABC transporter permease [Bordetella genomosp. 2]